MRTIIILKNVSSCITVGRYYDPILNTMEIMLEDVKKIDNRILRLLRKFSILKLAIHLHPQLHRG